MAQDAFGKRRARSLIVTNTLLLNCNTRSERIGPDGEQSGRPEDQLEIQARKEAWARASPFAQGQLPHGTRPYVAPPDSIIVPTQRTGFTTECSQDASEAMTAGPPGSKCAMCRLNEGWKAVDIS